MRRAPSVSCLGCLAILLIAAFPGDATAQEVDWAKRVEEARALEASGKAAEALEALKAIVLELPAERVAEFREPVDRAWGILRGEGRFREAEELFRKAVERRPDDSFCESFLAQALQDQGKTEEAAALYRKLGAHGGAFGAWALHNLGTILGRNEKTWPEAADAFLGALRGNPSHPTTVEWANHIAGRTNQQRRFGEAKRIWLGIGEIDGVDPSWRSLALLYACMVDYRQGRLEEAEPVCRRAIELSPMNPELLNNLGLIQLARGDDKGALETLQAALFLDPSFPDSLENLGRYWMARKDPAKARDFAARGYGVAIARLKKAGEAEAEARKSLAATLPMLEYEAKRERYRVYRFETLLRAIGS